MGPWLFSLVWIALAIIALYVSLGVLRDIYHEARERRARDLSADGPSVQNSPDTTASTPETTDESERICSSCGTVNESGYTYCQQCASRLQYRANDE